ncbi:hypothetical protein [Ruegeria faecimaris]|uniref:Sensory transduction regulator n=1 Tax=Ruegeria faecimaris TaxID=686389 RepID=A0A521EWV7_9RHOB|nr:hypothetical protein [Ruegeria faecimaris]SMO88376.1 hypothetical protein SAMN06265380_11475 [Ruegeria faecimaris]
MFRLILIFTFLASGLSAQEAEPPMTYERLGKILFALDPETEPLGPGFQLTIAEVPVLVITDVNADRMRAMVSIQSVEDLSAQDMQRMMQANFDSTLDARYAIANGTLWAAFIHPLSRLERDQLISGLAQTVNIANTYGTLYSSGVAEFGGGDSNDLQRALIEELLKKGEDI